MRDIRKIFDNCIKLCEEAGIHDYGNIVNVKVNTRAKHRWGQTVDLGFNKYEIEINKILLDEGTKLEGLQNTIIHEILHTCPNCFDHGDEWVRRAEIVKRELGYNIKRVNNAQEKGVSEKVLKKYYEPKYIVRCTHCGHEAKRDRMCSIIKYPSNWRCGVCGGTFERIK